MMQRAMYAILVVCICVQILAAQTSNFKTDNPFLSGAADLNSDNPNPEALETFVRTFTSAVYSSIVLPSIFDLSQFPAEAFMKAVYDHAYGSFVKMGHSDPETLAKVASTPLGTGAEAFTLPITVGIFANTAGRHLFANNILNPDNAVSLGMKFANSMEESAKRTWLKDRPESKFPAILDGFVDFVSSLELFDPVKVADLALYFAMEVKNAGKTTI